MPYEYDKSSTSEFELIEAGMYEAYIEKMETKETANGAKKVAVQFRIRTDIDQKHQNRVLFDDIWKEKNSEFYNRKRLNQLMATQDFEDGTRFESIQDVIDSLVGRPVQIKVVVSYDDYRDEDVNRIAYYKQSEHQPQELGKDDSEQKDKGTEKKDSHYETSKELATEDDLPF